MPTKDNITWGLIGFGMPVQSEDYFKQLLDRHIPIVIADNLDFGTIETNGKAHDYNYYQLLLILGSLLVMVTDKKNKTGHSLIQHGCEKEQLSRLLDDYKTKQKKDSSFT